MCIEAVKINPFNLKEVPETFLTEELCLTAVEHDSMAMGFVPKDIKTKRFCLKAIDRFYSYNSSLYAKIKTI